MLKKLTFVVSILLFWSSSSFADLGNMSGVHGSIGGAHNSSTRSMRIIDEEFEKGKGIFLGRNREVGKIKLCIASGDEQVKLKRKTLKPYKGATVNGLVNSLHNCDKPDEVMLERLGRVHMSYLIYYLNKRYKLQLTEHSKSVIAS
jgi:hypothetical protein